MKAWFLACTATASLIAGCGGSSSSPGIDNTGGSATNTADAGTHHSPDGGTENDGAAVIDAGDAPSKWASVGLPPFSNDVVAHIQEIRALGQTMGNRLNVFAKVGDSTTASTHNLWFFGMDGQYNVGEHTELQPIIDVFHFLVSPYNENSFNRQSYANIGGWRVSDAIKPPSEVDKELAEIKPAWALVMFGTNDLETYTADEYRANMTTLLDIIEARGVVISLSTINDRLDFGEAHGRVIAFNEVVRDLAKTRHLALLELYGALEPLPNHGVAEEGIHPSHSPTLPYEGCDISNAALQYGYNYRNFLELQMLDRFRSIP
jgi:hypothetical protein